MKVPLKDQYYAHCYLQCIYCNAYLYADDTTLYVKLQDSPDRSSRWPQDLPVWLKACSILLKGHIDDIWKLTNYILVQNKSFSFPKNIIMIVNEWLKNVCWVQHFFCFCLCLCKNSDGLLQLLTRFVGQQYNAVGIRWNPCFVGMKSLDICQFVGGKKCNDDTKWQFLHYVAINYGVFYHSAIKCCVGRSSLAP